MVNFHDFHLIFPAHKNLCDFCRLSRFFRCLDTLYILISAIAFAWSDYSKFFILLISSSLVKLFLTEPQKSLVDFLNNKKGKKMLKRQREREKKKVGVQLFDFSFPNKDLINFDRNPNIKMIQRLNCYSD